MAENTYRKQKKVGNTYNKVGWANNMMDNFADLDSVVEKGLPTKYLPRLLFLVFLGIIYISNAHYAEKMIRTLNKSEIETENLRADYTTIKVEFLYASKQSEIVERAKEIGLIENNGKTFRITVNKDEY